MLPFRRASLVQPARGSLAERDAAAEAAVARVRVAVLRSVLLRLLTLGGPRTAAVFSLCTAAAVDAVAPLLSLRTAPALRAVAVEVRPEDAPCMRAPRCNHACVRCTMHHASWIVYHGSCGRLVYDALLESRARLRLVRAGPRRTEY